MGAFATLMVLVCAVLVGGCAAPRPGLPGREGVEASAGVVVERLDLVAALPEGAVTFDLFLPASAGRVPLVVVAHGFMRSKAHMADWGRHLAGEGIAAAVLTMPTMADHGANGRAVDGLMGWLVGSREFGARLDGRRLGCMGHSAGGLATLLAAAGNPRIAIWVGLDPVDLGGVGMAAIPKLRAKAVVVRAEPSVWNSLGNARELVKALGGRCEDHLVAGANHIDPEWPTDLAAQVTIGIADERRRGEFVGVAVGALKAALVGGEGEGGRARGK